MRFSERNGGFVKNSENVLCDNVILFPIESTDGSLVSRRFILKALVNHVGTMVNGHYTAIIKDHTSGRWLHLSLIHI